MLSRKLSPAIGVASFALMSAAVAADMPGMPMPMPMPGGPHVTDFFSAWYLRLDGGYRANQITGPAALGTPLSSSTINDTAMVGGGIGYKWSWFRADITVDYSPGTHFSGITVPPAQTITATIDNVTTMLNVYADLGTWWGFTPYLGGGFGYSYLKPSHETVTPGIVSVNAVTDNSRWAMSWAAMGGLSYAITPVLMVDASYRYLDLGRPQSVITPVADINYGHWTAQEIRLGLRYLIP